jgi:hypothetical protein
MLQMFLSIMFHGFDAGKFQLLGVLQWQAAKF